MSRTELEHKIATLTGGRVAEDLVFHEITTGASNDIEQATKLARAMISQYGMCDAFGMITLGNKWFAVSGRKYESDVFAGYPAAD